MLAVLTLFGALIVALSRAGLAVAVAVAVAGALPAPRTMLSDCAIRTRPACCRLHLWLLQSPPGRLPELSTVVFCYVPS